MVNSISDRATAWARSRPFLLQMDLGILYGLKKVKLWSLESNMATYFFPLTEKILYTCRYTITPHYILDKELTKLMHQIANPSYSEYFSFDYLVEAKKTF